MNEDQGLCEICYEIFDNSTKLPKQMPCCKNIICLKCLKDIYENRKQTTCPMCRCDQKIVPDFLVTHISDLNQRVTCPSCNANAVKSSLYYSFTDKNLKCKACEENDITLSEYIKIILDDVALVTAKYQNVTQNVLIDQLRAKIKQRMDRFFDEIKKQVSALIEMKLIREMKENFSFDLTGNGTLLKSEVSKFSKSIINLSAFLKDSGNNAISMKTITTAINNYVKSKENIESLDSNFKSIQNLIKENSLFDYKNDLEKEGIAKRFVDAFDTTFSDHVDISHFNKINLFEISNKTSNHFYRFSIPGNKYSPNPYPLSSQYVKPKPIPKYISKKKPVEKELVGRVKLLLPYNKEESNAPQLERIDQ